jgi:hypothetical protein
MLGQSYNEYVRYGVALGYGIIGTLTKDKSIHGKIKELWEDKQPLVK